MSEFNYLKEKRRYLDSIGRTEGGCTGVLCNRCMFDNISSDIRCSEFEMVRPEDATELIRKWAEEHPCVTNADKFKEMFGVEPSLSCCPISCNRSCKEPDECKYLNWWKEEYEVPESV